MAQFIYTMNPRSCRPSASFCATSPELLSRRQDRRAGPERLRQIDAAEDHGRRRQGHRRRGAAAARHQGRLPAAGAAARRAKTVREVVGEGVGDVQGLIDRFNAISDRFAEPMSDDEMNKLMAEQAKMQDKIDAVGGWELERKLEIAADALRLPPWDARHRQAVGRREAPRRAVPAAAVEARHAAARRADQPPRRRIGGLARAFPRGIPGTVVAVTHDRYFLDNVAELDPGARPRPRHSVEGNYSSWLEQKEKRLAQESASRTRAPRP
jgi:hypothetical protein